MSPISLPPDSRHERAWMKLVLAAAAVYNLAWGAWVVLDPGALFRLTGIAPPLYPQIWQCVGMIVGVYGVGYAVAATAPLRHWPIVLVGLLGKVLGPAGFVLAVAGGALPASWSWTILANDIVWWVPFALILAAARRVRIQAAGSRPLLTSGPSIAMALRMARSQQGESLLSLSRRRPRLLVALRHIGCSFCRETLAELSRRRREIESTGAGIVLLHPATDDERAARLLSRYGLEELPRIADPGRVLYRSLGLARGRLGQVFGPRVLWRALTAALRGHRPGRRGGDVWQMPGAFLVADGTVVASLHHRNAAEQIDFVALASGRPESDRPRQRRQSAGGS